MIIFPYKSGSKSAKDLATELNIKRIRHNNSRFRPREGKLLLNWGCSSLPEGFDRCTVINKPEKVRIASDKRLFFHAMEDTEVRTPRFTESKQEVAEDNNDLRADSCTWIARHTLNGHSGQGIELIYGGQADIPNAPLYVRYVKKSKEYRVHIFRGEVVDIQRKARNRDVPDDQVNWEVRNHSNGFIFARNEDEPTPGDVTEQAKLCVTALGLDFGAVDVIYNSHEDQAYVIEVNTAPGLTGETLVGYVDRFRRLI